MNNVEPVKDERLRETLEVVTNLLVDVTEEQKGSTIIVGAPNKRD